MKTFVYLHGNLEHRMAQGMILAYYSEHPIYEVERWDMYKSYGVLPDVLLSTTKNERDKTGKRIAPPGTKRFVAIEIERTPYRAEAKYAAYRAIPGLECYVVTIAQVRAVFGWTGQAKSKDINEVLP